LRALWAGQEAAFPLEGDQHAVRTYPAPLQESIPLWLTAMSGPGTFLEAGRHGFNVLTAYLQQTPDQLTENIARYRQALSACGTGATGHVTLMVHACVADTEAEALRQVEEPLLRYQGQFLDLAGRPHDPGSGEEPLTEDERRELARYAVHKYANERGLVGDEATVTARLRQLAAVGVDEVACLVDFGLAPELVTRTLTRLAGCAKAPARPATPAGLSHGTAQA
jgi:natural product biosynthesis luciferase-like monooxygenase protein